MIQLYGYFKALLSGAALLDRTALKGVSNFNKHLLALTNATYHSI